jgi:hypothetical protein
MENKEMDMAWMAIPMVLWLTFGLIWTICGVIL